MISEQVINEIAGEIGERRGSERRAVVRKWAAFLSVSEQGIYRAIKQHALRLAPLAQGYRKIRKDHGQTRLELSEKQLELVAAIMMESWDEKGRIKMPAKIAIKMAEDGGAIPAGVLSACTFNRWLARRRITKREALAPTPHVELRSEGVNHVHEYDTSQCAQWFIKPIDPSTRPSALRQAQGSGLAQDSGQAFSLGWQRWDYKNKPLKGLPLKRHLIVDHFSGCFFVAYLPSEDCASSLEFLFSAWQRKNASVLFATLGLSASADQIARADRIAGAFPWHGVPKLLMTDNGSLVKSAVGRQVLGRLGIEFRTHEVGNPRAKGSVEGMMWKWEQAFESQLRRKPARDLVEFNLRAWEFASWYQQTQVHRRHGMTRFGCFMGDMDKMGGMDRIRELPEDRALLRALAMRAEEERQIDYKGVIRFDGKFYAVADQGLWGKTALVGLDVFNAPDLFVKCDGKEFMAKALDILPGGFTERSVPIGEYRAPRATETQERIKEIARIDINSELRIANSELGIEQISAPRGAVVKTDGAVVERIFSRIQAKHEAQIRLGYRLMNWQIAAIENAFGERGEVKESELDRIIESITSELRSVNCE